jgi:hypothetical protein
MLLAYQVNLGRVVLDDLILIDKCFGDSKYLYLSDVLFVMFIALTDGVSLVIFRSASKFMGSENFKVNCP